MAEQEFKKIKWNTRDISLLEKQRGFFISEEILNDSYIFKHLEKKITKVNTTQLGKKCEKTMFVPGIKYIPKLIPLSNLDTFCQEHILRAMKLLSSNKPLSYMEEQERFSLEIYNQVKDKILEENIRFNKYVQSRWERTRYLKSKLENSIVQYAKNKYFEKIRKIAMRKESYRQFNQFNVSINPTETDVEFKMIGNLLQLGTQAKFSKPSLQVECTLKASSLPNESLKTFSQLNVSEDKNILKLLQNNDFDVAISSSALKRILDYTDSNSKWLIPVKIKYISKEKEKGVKKKVVFIDKTLPSSIIDPFELKYYSMKRMLKTNFCQFEAFKYEEQDEHPDKKMVQIQDRLLAFEKQLDEAEKPETAKKDFCNNTIHHNANYKLWSIEKRSEQNVLLKNKTKDTKFNLLVRSKIDGVCEMEESPLATKPLQPVIVLPKIEYQLEYGVSIPTKTELSREWTSLFFRPFSVLYRARVHWKSSEVVSLDKRCLQKITNEAISLHNFNPYQGLKMLANLLNNLRGLEEGNYLLRHSPNNENFISILRECNRRFFDFDYSSEYNENEIFSTFRQNWVPIDLNYILPIHEYLQRPPGLFKAKKVVKSFSKKGKKKSKSKKSKQV